MISNTLYNTNPIVFHAHSHYPRQKHWPIIREYFFGSEKRSVKECKDLTIITCNNGHEAMGLFESSLAHLGLDCVVKGAGIEKWVNSVHKPPLLLEAAEEARTPYILYVDSRDAILMDDPQILVDRYEAMFKDNGIVFSADLLSWPTLPEFTRFERSLPGAADTDFKYLNGGVWMGKTEFCRKFWARALETPPVEARKDSEQGILRRVFQEFVPSATMDYRCALFQNIGFVEKPIFRYAREVASDQEPSAETVASSAEAELERVAS